MVVEPLTCRQINGIANADDRLVANDDLGCSVGDSAVAIHILHRDDMVTHTGVGRHKDAIGVVVGDTLAVVACDTVTERSRACKLQMQCGTLCTADVDSLLPQGGSGFRIDSYHKGGVVVAVVCSCDNRSHKGIDNLVGARSVVVPVACRQCNGIAGADDRIVAHYNVGVGSRRETLALVVAEISYIVTCTCIGLHLSEDAVGVCHPVGHIAIETVCEWRCAREYDFDIGSLVAADIVGSFDNIDGRFGAYHHLVFGYARSDDSVAVALVSCLVASASHVGECCIARNGLGVGHIIVAVEQTSGRIVVGRGCCINIARAAAAGVAGCRVARLTTAAAVPAAAATGTAGTSIALTAVAALAEVAVLTVDGTCCQCAIGVCASRASATSCSLSTCLTSGCRIVIGALQAAAHATCVAVGRTAAATCHNGTCIERGRIYADIGGSAAATALIVLARIGVDAGIAAAIPTTRVGGAKICCSLRVLAPAANKYVQSVALVYRQHTFGVATLTASVERCR